MNSMTGFGRALAVLPHSTFRVEISGINRKQVELAINMPRSFACWEQQVRPLITDAVSRGRVTVSISPEPTGNGSAHAISLDEGKLSAYLEQIKRASDITGVPLELTASDLIRMEIIHAEHEHADLLTDETWDILEQAIKQAITEFITMRATEGENLKQDILSKLATLEELRQQIMTSTVGVPDKLREAMMKRLEEAGIPVDLTDERILKEIAIFADKTDITEETTRLQSHFTQFLNICNSSAPAGRPLDFLCQEIFREFNTIGSKANDAELAHLVVTAKTELEKIREQVQNIE